MNIEELELREWVYDYAPVHIVCTDQSCIYRSSHVPNSAPCLQESDCLSTVIVMYDTGLFDRPLILGPRR